MFTRQIIPGPMLQTETYVNVFAVPKIKVIIFSTVLNL